VSLTSASLLSRTRILVVEDNSVNLELVRDVLEGAGYTVLAAVNGDDGLRMAQTELPDLVLMDLQLPGMDGLEVTRRLKADPATSSIQIIALTAHAMLGDDESIVAAGCDGYITKPIRLGPFRETVAAHVGRSHAEKSQPDPSCPTLEATEASRRSAPNALVPVGEERRTDIC
jgi:two-component system, cell cycle response regulator DivK